jgi:hypothetical protein
MSIFDPTLSVATRRGCVIVQGTHLGHNTDFVMGADEARDLARRLLAQADAAEHPRHCGMPGVEVTEFVPVTAGAPA